MNEDIKEWWDEVKAKVEGTLSPELVLLFGSRAQEREKDESDFDILVVSEKFQDLKRRERAPLVKGLFGEIPLELLCYTPEEFRKEFRQNPFIQRIYQEGLVLSKKVKSKSLKEEEIYETMSYLCKEKVEAIELKLKELEGLRGERRKKQIEQNILPWFKKEIAHDFYPFVSSLSFFSAFLKAQEEKSADDILTLYLAALKDEETIKLSEEQKALQNIIKASPDLSIFPSFSWHLYFRFTLAKPYFSKDEEILYIHDNPLRKDKVFKLPMIAPTEWKGNLRWAMRLKRDKEIIDRLFGNEKGEERQEDLKKGRLIFYPSFFDKVSLEVINPRDRSAGSGIQPIYLETIPEGASGNFDLLYLPFDLIADFGEAERQAGEDLVTACQSLSDLMLKLGFSAKKSSGFGIAEEKIKGDLFLKTRFGIISKELESLSELKAKANELLSQIKDD